MRQGLIILLVALLIFVQPVQAQTRSLAENTPVEATINPNETQFWSIKLQPNRWYEIAVRTAPGPLTVANFMGTSTSGINMNNITKSKLGFPGINTGNGIQYTSGTFGMGSEYDIVIAVYNPASPAKSYTITWYDRTPGKPVQSSAPGITIKFSTKDHDGVFSAYSNHNTVQVEVRGSSGNPLSGATITMTLDVTGLLDEQFSNFAEVRPGIYVFDFNGQTGLTGNSAWMGDRIGEDSVTINVSHPALGTVSRQATVTHIDPFGHFLIPPSGYSIYGYHSNADGSLKPLTHVVVDGQTYAAYMLRYENEKNEFGTLWLVVDGAGNFPPAGIYRRALKAIVVEQYLCFPPEFLRQLAADYTAISTVSSVVHVAQLARDAGARVLGRLTFEVATGQLGTKTAATAVITVTKKALAKVIADQMRSSVMPTDSGEFFESLNDLMLKAVQVRLLGAANSALQTANLIEKHQGNWSDIEANLVYDGLVDALVTARGDLDLLNTLLPDTSFRQQLWEISKQYAKGVFDEVALAQAVFTAMDTAAGGSQLSDTYAKSKAVEEETAKLYTQYFGRYDTIIDELTPVMLERYRQKFGGNAPFSSGSSAPSTFSDSSAVTGKVISAANDPLNVRSGPGANYTILGKLNRDTVVTLIGRTQDGSWVQVKGYTNGWVNARYLQPSGNIMSLPVTVKPQTAATNSPIPLAGKVTPVQCPIMTEPYRAKISLPASSTPLAQMPRWQVTYPATLDNDPVFPLITLTGRSGVTNRQLAVHLLDANGKELKIYSIEGKGYKSFSPDPSLVRTIKLPLTVIPYSLSGTGEAEMEIVCDIMTGGKIGEG